MRKIILIITLAFFCTSVTAQQTLTMEQAISLAQSGSYDAAQVENEYQKGVWEFNYFTSTFKPHLEFNLNPNQVKETYDHRYSYAISRDYDMFSTLAELRLNQKISAFGGDLYMSSSGIWTEHFHNSNELNRIFGITPFRLGYQQDLLGFNRYKYEKSIEQVRRDNVDRTKVFEMWQIAQKTALLYLNALRAESLYDMYQNNAETAEFLYNIGKEKYAIASIRNDELSSLELQWLNSTNSCSLSKIELDNALTELTSYLGLSAGTIVLQFPAIPDYFALDENLIYSLIEKNNPIYTNSTLSLLEAQMEEERTRKEIGVQASLDINLGVQNYAGYFGNVFSNQSLFSVSGINIRIPIIDQKSAKSKHKAAQYNVSSTESSTQERQRELKVEVAIAIREFENSQSMIQTANHTMELAEQAYAQANENYANGIADVNTFAIAQTRKENAYSNFLDAFCNYWNAYYRLSMLCGCDIMDIGEYSVGFKL